MKRIIILALTICFGLGLGPAWGKDTLFMGVHPFKPAGELYKIFKPIADEVSKATGKSVEFQVATDYADAAKKLNQGTWDFAYLGPTIYLDVPGAIPLAQILNSGKPTFYGVIVTKRGSGIKSIKDLKGKKIAFGDRKSTMTHVVPLYMLLNEGITVEDLGTHAFLGAHDNVIRYILEGAYDAGGVMPDIAEKYKDKGLVVVTRTPEIPEHVFVATPGMDPALAGKIQATIFSLDPALYKAIKPTLTGMAKFKDKDFDILRKIVKATEQDLEK